MSGKLYITAEELLCDSFELGARVIESGFRPDFIVGIWRGGTPVGIAVQETLHYFELSTDHIAIRTSSYRGIGERDSTVKVHGMGYIVRNVNAEDALLIVDDVYDTGLSVAAVLEHLHSQARKNTPRDIRIATPWFKPASNRTGREPDYYIHRTDKWLVFPHEVHGLSIAEICKNKPGIAPIIQRLERRGRD